VSPTSKMAVRGLNERCHCEEGDMGERSPQGAAQRSDQHRRPLIGVSFSSSFHGFVCYSGEAIRDGYIYFCFTLLAFV
jgi:hypothetical protein